MVNSAGQSGYIKQQKVIIALLFGLIGFTVNFFPINFDFTPYRASFFFGLVFPLLISQAWGMGYGFLSATLGLGAQTMWFHWLHRSGWGSLVSVPPFTLWILWHGWAYARFKKMKVLRWNPYITEIPFRILNIVLLYTLFRWACSFNPPPWAPEIKTAGVPLEYVHFIAVKEVLNAYVMLLLADVLINVKIVRRFLRLRSKDWENRTFFVISASLLVGLAFWFIDSVIDYIFFFKKGALFTDVLLFNVSAYELYFRFSFIFGCLFMGFLLSRLLAKKYESELARVATEERLNLALKVTNDGVWDWDIGTGQTYFNDRYFTMLGYEPHELPSTYETWTNLLHPDDRESAQAYVWQHIQENKPGFVREFRLKKKDGDWCWVLARGNIVKHDEHGKPMRMMGTHVDITERKHMENALRKSEEQHRVTINSIDHSIHVIDRDFRVVLCNKTTIRWNRFFGFQANMAGEVLFTIYPFLTDVIRREYEKVFETGKPLITEEHNTIGTHDVYTETRKIPIFDEDKVTQVLTIIDNTTHRKMAERTLRESEERLAVTLDSIGDCVIVTDTAGTVMRMNHVAQHMTGWDFSDASGRALPEVLTLVDQETREPLENPVLKVLREGHIVELANKVLLIARDGQERIVADSGAPICDKDGTIVGAVIVMRDMTKQVEVEEQLRHAQKMKAIGQLAGGIAHDFNNLLTGISNFAELLKTHVAGNEKAEQYLNGIAMTAQRASSLTSKLLTFARKGKYTVVETNLHAIIDEVIEIFKHSVDKKINIVKNYASIRPVVNGDPTQIQNAILNIAINARDAMPRGGDITFMTRDLHLSETSPEKSKLSLPAGNYLQVSIADTGIGISDDIKDHIFEPFFTTKPVGKGIGMGLAAVYGTIEDHNGAVTVESSRDKGSTFHLYLPIAEAPASDKLSAEKASAVVKGSGTILFVDDDKSVRKSTKEMLIQLGYSVSTCSDGDEAIQHYREFRDQIDLVILDMIMPKMDGWELFRTLRAINPAVKVLIATGYAFGDTTQDLIHAGALAILQKPFKISALSQTVAKALRN
jgi:PAS domain S-box-containing protein